MTLRNPLSESQSILRPTLLCSLLDAAAHNIAHNGPDVEIFESGTVYLASAGGLADEHHAIGALLTGSTQPRAWRGTPARHDFFTAKALVEELLDALHVDARFEREAWPFLHPGRSAAVETDSGRLGFVGELHPLVAAEWEVDGAASSR